MSASSSAGRHSAFPARPPNALNGERRARFPTTPSNTLRNTPIPAIPIPPIPPVPALPLNALAGERRARVPSSANPRDARKPSRQYERTRATTLAGPPASVLQIRANPNANASDEEMKKGMLLGVEKTVDQFDRINRQTQEFSNTWAEHAARFKHLPRSSPPVDATYPVARPASEFQSAEDYAFFSLISVINTHLYNAIFRPFHPAVSAQQNSMFEQGYQRQIQTALQIIVASWRSRAFGSIEASINAAQKAGLFRDVATSIQRAWLDGLNALPGDLPPLPSAFMAQIENILSTAYEWNRVVKMEVVKYDFEPFAFKPLSTYDPERMEPFELRRPVQAGGKIVSSVSLGLLGSIAMGGRRVSHVQHKARVLLEEWFSNTKKKAIAQQPKATPPMRVSTPAGPSAPPRQDPPPPPKKGCC